MKMLNKLKEAREIIRKSDLKKVGHNEYSKFSYYTPEQVEQLVANACEETKTIALCNLKADEFGLFQSLDLMDLESEESLHFEMRTKHGSITATNETQQMGGTDTYSERYIKMKVFQIKDNNLDFDSQAPAKKAANKAITMPSYKVKLFQKIKQSTGLEYVTKEDTIEWLGSQGIETNGIISEKEARDILNKLK